MISKAVKAALVATTLATAAVGTIAAPAWAESGVITVVASQNAKIVKITQAKPKTVRTTASFNEIVVGDPEVATVSPLTDRSFYIVGTKPGSTGIALYGENNELVGVLDVEVGPNTNQLNAALKEALPGSNVSASSTNGKVIIKGNARSSVAAKKAQAIAQKFDPEPINAVKVEGSQQVKLEVRFIEAQRERGKELGVSTNIGRNSPGTLIGNSTNLTAPRGDNLNQVADGNGNELFALADLISGSAPFGQFVASILRGGIDIDVFIQSLEERGVARRLAEPNLVALSGDTASFLAGGEFPIPVGQDEGKVTIEFKEFGVGLEFTPTVLDNGLINLKLAPEVSQLDFTNAFQIFDRGPPIPALVTRKAQTTLELRDGQSFVLGGLLQKTNSTSKRQVPWLSDVPILGALFRSASYQKNETDLVIIVTPRLVKPLTPGQVPATPLDATAPANDIDLFVNGDTEVSRAHLRKLAEARSGTLKSGHVIELE
ncbi:MAG: type II and III secretion system protein family protein [Rhizobiaceae bacterium]|nr:type II and III secretion system protein family protein [Rhizobiaceae bacterium]